MGEYGGIGLPVEGHIWRPGKKNWGYQVATGEQDYLARFRRKMDEVIRQAKAEGLSASVYTQTTDVEDEINGLLTYDRAAPKAPAEALRSEERSVGKEGVRKCISRWAPNRHTHTHHLYY